MDNNIVDNTTVNREYTEAERRFSTEEPLLGGIGRRVAEEQQAEANRQEVLKRNEVLSKDEMDNTQTMEVDEYQFSFERDKAVSKTALNSNWFFDWLDERERNDRFAKADETGDVVEIKDTLAADILNNNQLPEEYLSLMKSSKTIDGLQSRIDWAKEDATTKGYIAKALSDKEQTITSITSSLATPDVVLGIVAPVLLYKTASIAGKVYQGTKAAQLVGSTPFIAGVEFGVEAGINLFHSSVDYDYSKTEAVLDTIIYGSAGTFLTRLVTPYNLMEVAKITRTDEASISPKIPDRLFSQPLSLPKKPQPIIKGEARGKPYEAVRNADGQIIEITERVTGTARATDDVLILKQEGSVSFPSAIGEARVSKSVGVDRQAGTVDEWTEATIDNKPVYVYGNSKGETVYELKGTGKVIKVVQEEYKPTNLYGADRASKQSNYVKKEGQVYEITKDVQGAGRQTHSTTTLKSAGVVEKRYDEIITEVANPAELKAIDNVKAQQVEAKAYRQNVINEIKAKLEPLINKLSSEMKVLKDKLASGTDGQVKYRQRKIAKLQKQIDEANEELKLIDTGHQKTMEEYSDTIKGIEKSMSESPKKSEVNEMFAHYMQEPIQHIKEIRDFIKTNPDKEYMKAVQGQLDELRAKFPEEVTQIENLIKSKVGNKEALRSEWYKKLSPHNKKILVGAGILGASGLSADDGDIDMTSVLALAVLGMFGIANRQAVHALFTSGSGVGGKVENLKNSFSKAVTGIVNEEGMNNVGAVRKGAAAIAEKAYTQLFSASAPFIKAGGVASEFIQKMLYNKDFGGGALTMKNEWFKSAMADYMSSESKNFRLWLAENNKTENKVAQNTNDMEQFRELILDVKEGIVKTDSKAVNDMAKLMNEKFSDMLISNKEYKTHGFDKITFDSNYVPRLWRTELIQKALRAMTDNQVKAFTNAIAKSIKGDNAQQTAEQLVTGWKTATLSASDSSKADVISMLSDKKLLKDGEDIDDILDAITGVKDRQSRAKYRIDMDMKVLKDEINKLGIDSLKFNDILDRSSVSVFDKFGNQMYASAALSREGITSSVILDKMIKDVAMQDKVLGHQAEQIRDLVLGVPLPVDNEFLHTISSAMKDLTLGGKLPLVALSTPTEIIQTIFSNGFFNGLKNIKLAIGAKYGKESEMLNQLAKIGSLGRSTDLIDLKYAHRGFSNEFIDGGETVYSAFREGTMKFRDFVIFWSGLAGITDILQIANKFAHTEQLGRIANGMENGIPLERYTEFGITEARMKALKPYMVFDANGVLQKVDLDAMPRKVKDDYQEMMFNMNQAITPETTVGETPLFTRTSSLGRIITTLSAYPLQQFNLHGIQGVKRADKYSAIQLMGGIAGTYIGLSARNELLERDMTDETLLWYSMLNAPQGLGLSAIHSFIDPAVIKHNKDLMSLADVTQYVD